MQAIFFHYAARSFKVLIAFLVLVVPLTGCAVQKMDYTLFREHFPRSILVLPPVNQSVDIDASTQYLSTFSTALGEAGYYVFPIAIVDQMLKENGVAIPDEMHHVPLAKLREVFGADAVLYIEIQEWGTRYLLLSSETRVTLRYRLVDTETGTQIWERVHTVRDDSGGGSNLIDLTINAAVHAVGNVLQDRERWLAVEANNQVVNRRLGLLKGPYHPKHFEDLKGQTQ